MGGLITDEVASNIFKQFDALDRMAEERERLKRETMDGCRLAKGLEVFSSGDPFYGMIVFDPMLKGKEARCTVRQRRDRRTKDIEYLSKNLLYRRQFEAFAAALKKHDKMAKEVRCRLENAERVKAEIAETRLELLDGMAICINKDNPHAAQLNMESKKFRKKRK